MRYDILKTCVDELMRVGIVAPVVQLQSSADAQRAHEASETLGGDASAAASGQLFACSIAAEGFSGRALRKLPFLAHTLCQSGAEVSAQQVRAHVCVVLRAVSCSPRFSTSACCKAPFSMKSATGKCCVVYSHAIGMRISVLFRE